MTDRRTALNGAVTVYKKRNKMEPSPRFELGTSALLEKSKIFTIHKSKICRTNATRFSASRKPLAYGKVPLRHEGIFIALDSYSRI